MYWTGYERDSTSLSEFPAGIKCHDDIEWQNIAVWNRLIHEIQ